VCVAGHGRQEQDGVSLLRREGRATLSMLPWTQAAHNGLVRRYTERQPTCVDHVAGRAVNLGDLWEHEGSRGKFESVGSRSLPVAIKRAPAM